MVRFSCFRTLQMQSVKFIINEVLFLIQHYWKIHVHI